MSRGTFCGSDPGDRIEGGCAWLSCATVLVLGLGALWLLLRAGRGRRDAWLRGHERLRRILLRQGYDVHDSVGRTAGTAGAGIVSGVAIAIEADGEIEVAQGDIPLAFDRAGAGGQAQVAVARLVGVRGRQRQHHRQPLVRAPNAHTHCSLTAAQRLGLLRQRPSLAVAHHHCSDRAVAQQGDGLGAARCDFGAGRQPGQIAGAAVQAVLRVHRRWPQSMNRYRFLCPFHLRRWTPPP